jgi:hypothetical protein
VEMPYACDEALRVLASDESPDAPAVEASPRAAMGTRTPRGGVLYHRYGLDADGTIADVKIVCKIVCAPGPPGPAFLSGDPSDHLHEGLTVVEFADRRNQWAGKLLTDGARE